MNMQIYRHNFELQIPAYYDKGNSNNALFHLGFGYGTANGYERRFEFNLLPWNQESHREVSKHNGHARFCMGFRLVRVFFDWTDKGSIVFS